MQAVSSPTVPTKWLVGPAVVLILVGGILALVVRGEGGQLNIHGGGGLMLLVFALVTVVTAVIELFALAIGITALVRAPHLRSPASIASVIIGTSPFLAIVWMWTQ